MSIAISIILSCFKAATRRKKAAIGPGAALNEGCRSYQHRSQPILHSSASYPYSVCRRQRHYVHKHLQVACTSILVFYEKPLVLFPYPKCYFTITKK
jgi:hypothetical protein